MDEGNTTIYGLEHQARALAPQIGENYAVRFLIGTQSLKPSSNQIHIVELEEETGALHTKVYQHPLGEIWHLRCSPHDASLLTSCHNSYSAEAGQCSMGSTLLRLPSTRVIPERDEEGDSSKPAEGLETVQVYDVEKYGQDIKCCEFHMTEPNRLAVVVDNSIVLFDTNGQQLGQTQLEGKGHLKFSGGKWNPHQNGHQFAAIQDTHLRSYDTRSDLQRPAWSLESAHSQHLRDLDFNPNKHFHLATVADDGCLKLWDYRQTKEPVLCRSDHSHWIWAVRFNTFHDQLLLTGSSDSRVLLTSAASVSSESPAIDAVLDDSLRDLEEEGSNTETGEGSPVKEANSSNDSDLTSEHDSPSKEKLADGPLQWYEQHEDSVYCVEWSSADPWTFASLSYDGRLVLARVPRQHKYRILL